MGADSRAHRGSLSHALYSVPDPRAEYLHVTIAIDAGRCRLAERTGAARGSLLGLLAYKPQLVTLVAIVMTAICVGWRVLLGVAITGASLLAVNVLTLPGTLGDFQHRLPLNLHFVLIETPYLL